MLKFRLGEKIIEFEEESFQEEKQVSKHTEEELTNYKIKISLKGIENKDWIEDNINNIFYKLDENDNFIGEYNGKIKSSSFSNQSDVYNYTIKLFEKENLDIEKLVIGDLEIEPYEYEEEFTSMMHQDEYLRMDVKSEVNYSEFMKLYTSEPKYFEIIREGINENPVNMRFGKVIWSNLEDTEKIKIDFCLVEKVYDDKRKNSLSINQPEVNHLIEKTAYKNKLFDILINHLIDKDILSKEKLKEFEEEAQEEIAEEAFQFVKVNDIDRY